MKTLCADLTVGEIAARQPASVRVFEKHRIDFCCGGKLPVGEACRARGLDSAAVLAEIEREVEAAGSAPEDASDWQSAGLGNLIEHIVSSRHVYLKTHLPRIQEMLDKVADKHSARHGDVLRPAAGIFSALHSELDAHLMKEETILFPLIRGMEAARETGQPLPGSHCGSVQNPIRVMLMEHDSAGDALERLREITAGYTAPEDACNTYRAVFFELAALESDLHRHIHLENNILFPRAMQLEG